MMDKNLTHNVMSIPYSFVNIFIIMNFRVYYDDFYTHQSHFWKSDDFYTSIQLLEKYDTVTCTTSLREMCYVCSGKTIRYHNSLYHV